MSATPPTDNPLAPNPERDARIKQVAAELWEADGSPEGREAEFAERADELVRMEMSGRVGQTPNPMTQGERIPGVMVEEASIQENLGEFPAASGADQGEKLTMPIGHKPAADAG